MQNLTTAEITSRLTSLLTSLLTTAEIDRLRTLRGRVENARNFTASAKAGDSLDAYIERLLAKGRDAEQIVAITTA